MIVDTGSKIDSGNSGMVSHITGEFVSLCDESEYVDCQNVEEVAKAVECFLEQESDCSFIESKHLVMLASQALSSIGEGQAARKFLFFGTGLVRPSEWEVTGEDSVWVLDLKQVTVRDGVALELLFFGTITVILEAIADVWDSSQGKGTLGLRHVSKAVSQLMGESQSKKDHDLLVDELKILCRSKLEKLSLERGWESFPGVLDMDI